MEFHFQNRMIFQTSINNTQFRLVRILIWEFEIRYYPHPVWTTLTIKQFHHLYKTALNHVKHKYLVIHKKTIPSVEFCYYRNCIKYFVNWTLFTVLVTAVTRYVHDHTAIWDFSVAKCAPISLSTLMRADEENDSWGTTLSQALVLMTLITF